MRNAVFLKKILLVSGFVFGLSFGVQANAASEFDPEHWRKHDPAQTFAVDHSAMTSILNYMESADQSRRTTAYHVFSGKALEFVQSYRTYLEGVKVSLLNRDEQLAYWLNLHNVGVIEKLASNFKKKGKLRALRGEPSEPGEWWAEKMFTVEGHALSLEEIEQDILMRTFAEPLALYGLTYGVRGTTTLGTKAFSGSTVRQQLEKLAKDFINNTDNVKVSRSSIRVNSLLAWNKEVLFQGSQTALFAHIADYAEPELKSKLQAIGEDTKLSHRFNWKSDAHRPQRQSFGVGSSVSSYGS